MDPAMVASASATWGPGGLHPPTQRYGEGRGERVRAGVTLADEENRERERTKKRGRKKKGNEPHLRSISTFAALLVLIKIVPSRDLNSNVHGI